MYATDFSGTVGTTVAKLADYNPRRVWMGIHNTSANILYLGLQAPVSSTRALVAIPSNAYYEFNRANPWEGQIWIVGSAAGTTYIAQEVAH